MAILKRVGFEIRDPEGGEALGATRYDEDEGVKADVFLANAFRDLKEDLDEIRKESNSFHYPGIWRDRDVGDINHERIIPLTPPTYGNVSTCLYHITQFPPANAIVIPTIPPTQE